MSKTDELWKKALSDPNGVFDWPEGDLNILLSEIGVDIDRMKDKFENEPKDPELETILEQAYADPSSIDSMPPELLKRLHTYLGAEVLIDVRKRRIT